MKWICYTDSGTCVPISARYAHTHTHKSTHFGRSSICMARNSVFCCCVPPEMPVAKINNRNPIPLIFASISLYFHLVFVCVCVRDNMGFLSSHRIKRRTKNPFLFIDDIWLLCVGAIHDESRKMSLSRKSFNNIGRFFGQFTQTASCTLLNGKYGA